MELRNFTMNDYDAVLALWRRFPDALGIGPSDSREEIAKKLTRDPDLFILAEETGKIAGTVIGGFDGRRGLIYHLAVAPEQRNSGLGRRLMQEVEQRLAARGCIRAYLLVKPENVDVIEFYRRLGWEAMPVTTMAKNLEPPRA